MPVLVDFFGGVTAFVFLFDTVAGLVVFLSLEFDCFCFGIATALFDAGVVLIFARVVLDG